MQCALDMQRLSVAVGLSRGAVAVLMQQGKGQGPGAVWARELHWLNSNLIVITTRFLWHGICLREITVREKRQGIRAFYRAGRGNIPGICIKYTHSI